MGLRIFTSFLHAQKKTPTSWGEAEAKGEVIMTERNAETLVQTNSISFFLQHIYEREGMIKLEITNKIDIFLHAE